MYSMSVVLQSLQDDLGETALHAASGQGHIQVIAVTLQKGANVHILTKVGGATGCSCLECAHVHIVQNRWGLWTV